jgi:hypothetical protein
MRAARRLKTWTIPTLAGGEPLDVQQDLCPLHVHTTIPEQQGVVDTVKKQAISA